MPYVLDTDIVSALQNKHPHVVARVANLPRSELFFTIVSFEEQCSGRLNVLNRPLNAVKLVEAYDRLRETLLFYTIVTVLPYDDAAARIEADLRVLLRRMGTKDRRIAAITLSHGYTLVTRNTIDFEAVPGLAPLENWVDA